MAAADPSGLDALAPAGRPATLPRLLRLAVLGAVGAFASMILPAHRTLAGTPSRAHSSQTAARKEAVTLSRLPPLRVPPVAHPPIDRSGRKEIGKASFYSRRFDGRKTAAGQRFNPNTNTAASKTLPIGTTAKVINLATGRSATVTVNDRGPYARGRMLDVTPKVAASLNMKRKGVAPVVVAPIAVPQPNGSVKLGAGAATTTPGQLRAAVRTTRRVTREARGKKTGR
ncbi:MAG TPA: septal ring lytic transglycosylase RlpA family protein [Acetobacteraceae bacterium]|nr:septal ring lytic transglycosylase RlpA family protein [Acetobacteraceae bacterium]